MGLEQIPQVFLAGTTPAPSLAFGLLVLLLSTLAIVAFVCAVVWLNFLVWGRWLDRPKVSSFREIRTELMAEADRALSDPLLIAQARRRLREVRHDGRA